MHLMMLSLNVLALALVTVGLAAKRSVTKRNVFYQFKPMVETLTGCSALSYVDYGCWCGLGHKAEAIVDGIDGCCKVHDTCYDVVQELHGCDPLEVNYGYTGSNCTDKKDTCAHAVCLCDMAASRCFQQYACPGDRACAAAPPPKRFYYSQTFDSGSDDQHAFDSF